MESYDCDPCKVRGKKTRGVKYCRTCEETFCAECADVHRSSKSTKNHTLLNITDLNLSSTAEFELQKLQRCKFHPEKHLEFFCKKHDTLICSLCLLQHRMVNQCNVIEVANAGEAILKSDFVHKVRTDLQLVTSQLEQEKQRIESQLSSSRQIHTQLREKNRQIRSAVLNIFDELENEIMFGVACDNVRENKIIEDLLIRINQMLVRINDTTDVLISTTSKGTSSDMFKCVLLVGNFLENFITEYQDTKREPIWISYNALIISNELQTILNKTISMVQRKRMYSTFLRPELCPLNATATEFLNIIDCEFQTDRISDQSHAVTTGFSHLKMKNNSSREDHEQDETIEMTKETYGKKNVLSQLPKSTQRLVTPQHNINSQRRSKKRSKSTSKQVRVIEQISDNKEVSNSSLPSDLESSNLEHTDIPQSSIQYRKAMENRERADNINIDESENLKEATIAIEEQVEVKCLMENEALKHTNVNEVCTSIFNEIQTEIDIVPVDSSNHCGIGDKKNKTFGQTFENDHSYEGIYTHNENRGKQSPSLSKRNNVQTEENITSNIDQMNYDVVTSVNTSQCTTKSEEIKVITKTHIIKQEHKTERKSESDANVLMGLETLRKDHEVFEVPGKSKSMCDHKLVINIKDPDIDIALPGSKRTFDLSVMAPSGDIIIICDYHNNTLKTLDAEQYELKDTFCLPAKVVNANLLKGQMIAACHKNREKVLLLAYTPSFKLIRVLDTQYKAYDIQSVDDNNMIVSMFGSSGLCHLHIISLTGQLKKRVKLSKSIVDPFNLAVISSDEFRFGYRILQSCLTTNTVYCFENDGKDIFKYKVKSPDCIAVHDSGFIFVTERIGRIHVLSSSGQKVYETKCCSDVTSIAVTPSMDKILLTRYKDKRISVLSIDFNTCITRSKDPGTFGVEN